MSIKPRRELQERIETESGMTHYLMYGELSPEANRFLNNFPDRIKAAWEKIGDSVTKDFIKQHPCRRPWAWWRFDAPQPRQRIGGTGKSTHESMNFAPGFSFGLPTSWTKLIDVELKLAKKNDLIDPDDPPTFESQASYLQRHNLLAPEEIKWLDKHPEALAPEIIEVKK
jgi:hypothetical protein